MQRGFLLGAASNDRGPRAAVTGKVRSVARSPDPMPSTIELVPRSFATSPVSGPPPLTLQIPAAVLQCRSLSQYWQKIKMLITAGYGANCFDDGLHTEKVHPFLDYKSWRLVYLRTSEALTNTHSPESLQWAIDFLAVSESLWRTRVHMGERQFKDADQFFFDMFVSCVPFPQDVSLGEVLPQQLVYCHDVFTEPILATTTDADFSQHIGEAWRACSAPYGQRLPQRQAEQAALHWMACEHPQAAVRAAARELELRRQQEQQQGLTSWPD